MRKDDEPFLQWIAQRSKKQYTIGNATVIENPQNNSIFKKSPLSSLVKHPEATCRVIDQCQHGCVEPRSGMPARKSTTLLELGIKLSKSQKRCNGPTLCAEHADLLGGKSAPLAVYPWKLVQALVSDFQNFLKYTVSTWLLNDTIPDNLEAY